VAYRGTREHAPGGAMLSVPVRAGTGE
jgi:hypothetical protein